MVRPYQPSPRRVARPFAVGCVLGATALLTTCVLPQEISVQQVRLLVSGTPTVAVADSGFFAIKVETADGRPFPSPRFSATSTDAAIVVALPGDGGVWIRGLKRGSTSVHVELMSGATGLADVPSTDIAVKVIVASIEVMSGTSDTLTAIGDSDTLRAVGKDARGDSVPDVAVTWSSSAPSVVSVVSVDSITGVVTARANGPATITANSVWDSVSGSRMIAVAQRADSVAILTSDTTFVGIGVCRAFDAGAWDRRGVMIPNPRLAWTSLGPEVATVDAAGAFCSVAEGSARITATVDERSDSVTIVVVVVASIRVTSPVVDSVMAVGRTAQLAAEARNRAGDTIPVGLTWTSTDLQVATVNSTGVVTGVSADTVSITATAGGQSGTLGLRVVAADLEGVRRLVDDTYLGAVVAQMTSTLGDLVSGALDLSRQAASVGNVLAVRNALTEAGGYLSGATTPDDRVLAAVAQLYLDGALLKLGL